MPKNSDGRSMIEMLCVLAIIGMLAIGGVWGIGKAFTKHNANNLIEDVRLAGFIVADEMFSSLPAEQEEVSMAGKFAPKSPYDFTAFKESDITFGVVADKVSFPVCEEVRKRKVDWLEEIRANSKENTCKKDDENTVSFFFNTQLNGNTEVSGECRTNKDCPLEKPYCRYGVCTKCENGLQLNNGTCTICPSVGEYKFPTNASYCHTCGNNVYFSTWLSYCVNCTVVLSATKSECARCPNRCWDEEKQQCLDSIEGNPFNDNGVCNYNCPAGQLVASNHLGGQWRCADCPAIGSQSRPFSTTEQCHSCGSNYMSILNGQYCRECTYPYSSGISIEDCKRCPNRCWDEEKQQCLDSIEGNPFNDNGVCNYNCPAGQLVASNHLGGQWRCADCPAIGGQSRPFSTTEQCYSCGSNYMSILNGQYCRECTNSYSWGVSIEECKRCPNRCWDEEKRLCLDAQVGNIFNNNGICNYNCPAGQLVASNDAGGQWRCADCPAIGGQSRPFSTTEQCYSCGSNYMSILNGQYCRECTSPYSWGVSIEECKRCPNRCWDEEKRLCLDAQVGNIFNNNGICNYNCPAGQLAASNDAGGQWRCTDCPAIGGQLRPFSTTEQCHSCGSNYMSILNGQYCRECTSFYSSDIPREECKRCPNRCWDEEKQLCLDSIEGNPFNDNGVCNYNCPAGQFAVAEAGNGRWRCANCPAIGSHLRPFSTTEQCHSCGSNYYANSTGERCGECTNTFLTSVPKSECDRCPNRYFDEEAQKCYLCPTGQKASDDGLSCIDL